MLHQVSYQELKSLVLQYPYSPNLRYLLLLKSLFDQSKDFDKNQVIASLSSPDRKKLRQLVKHFTRLRELQENYTLSEDFLELKDLSILEDLTAEPQQQTTAPPKGATIAPPTTPAGKVEEEKEEESDLSFLEGLIGGEYAAPEEASGSTPTEVPAEATEVDATPATEDFLEEQEATAGVEEEIPTEPEIEEPTSPAAEADEQPLENPAAAADVPFEIINEADLQPAPIPKSSFNAWLRKLNPPQAGILNTDLKDISLNSKHLHHEEEEKEASVKQIAEQSVEEHEEIASETLALLLEKQRFFGKAISMYQRLQLLYPEKSSLFAAKIEELNKKL